MADFGHVFKNVHPPEGTMPDTETDVQTAIAGLAKLMRNPGEARYLLDNPVSSDLPSGPETYPQLGLLCARYLLGNPYAGMALNEFVNEVDKPSQKAVRIACIMTAIESILNDDVTRFSEEVHILSDELHSNELAEDDETLQVFLDMNNNTIVSSLRKRIISLAPRWKQILEDQGWQALGG